MFTALLNYAADLEETSPRFPSDNTVPRQVAMALRGFDDHGPRSTIHAGELCADVPPTAPSAALRRDGVRVWVDALPSRF
jgi:hypothetical protein